MDNLLDNLLTSMHLSVDVDLQTRDVIQCWVNVGPPFSGWPGNSGALCQRLMFADGVCVWGRGGGVNVTPL